MSPITTQLVEKIRSRCQLYQSRFEADIARLSRVRGHGPVQEALEIVRGAKRAR
jgi:hypothetical protein